MYNFASNTIVKLLSFYNLYLSLLHFTSLAGAVAKYCGEYICLSVCPWAYLQNHMCDLYQIFVHAAYCRGSVLLRRRCNTLCTSGYADDIMFFFI